MVWWGSRPARAPFQGGGNLLQADFDPASGQLAFCHSYTQSVKNFAAWHAAFPLSRRFTVNRDFAVNRSCDMQQILWILWFSRFTIVRALRPELTIKIHDHQQTQCYTITHTQRGAHARFTNEPQQAQLQAAMSRNNFLQDALSTPSRMQQLEA